MDQALDFTAYIADRTKDFTGREWVFDEIDRWLADPEGPNFFIITGEPGIGKSAIAARLTQARELAAYHFCIARQADTIDPALFARSLSHQLCRIDGFALGLLKDSTKDIIKHWGGATSPEPCWPWEGIPHWPWIWLGGPAFS